VYTEFSTLVEFNRLKKPLTCSLWFLDDLEGLCLLSILYDCFLLLSLSSFFFSS
jgi:hypothetical protein